MTSSDARDRLKILAIYPWCSFWSMGEGRGAPSFYLSVTSFALHGHDMHVLMPGGTGTPEREDYHGVTLHRIPTEVDFMPECRRSKLAHHARIFATFVYWFLRAVPAGVRLCRELRPDVIFGMGSLGATAGWLVARFCRLPNVTRIFGTELSALEGSPIRLMLRYRDIAPYFVPARYYIMHNDGSGGYNAAVKYGVPPGRILYWPNGIDKNAYRAGADGRKLGARLGIPEGARVVMTASRLHPQLHVDRLIAAAPEVCAARDDAWFLIVGDGERRSRLESLARELGVAERVVFAGSLPRAEMVEAYALADVFVGLSDRTNMSNPLDEAMMSGLAVVVLNSGTTGDVVRDGENGVLLESQELPSLGRVLAELLGDAERRSALGKRARLDADRRLPTVEERQAMEVDVVERAVRESRRGR